MSETEKQAAAPEIESGTYEIIRNRLLAHGEELGKRLESLNAARREVFGAVPFELLSTEMISTAHNCVPRDIFPVGGNRFLFGFNVVMGLKRDQSLEDVFSLFEWRADASGTGAPGNKAFHPLPLEMLRSHDFEENFRELYKYYRKTTFAKFRRIGPFLFMVFRTGDSTDDQKTFKWGIRDDGGIEYIGNRFDHEFAFPPQHDFEWKRATRDFHRYGLHPHISIEDRVFVECVGGDLTIKIEDNTESGAGIYAEPVVNADQTLDDAEIHYASLGNLILLKIRPFQEKTWRHIIFNEKIKEARRIDSIEHCCVLLPDDQGIIFQNGTYLQSGEFKLFEEAGATMLFSRRVDAPNGEDYLYVFYSRETGEYVLLPYNRIERQVKTPLGSNGYSVFTTGELLLLKAVPDARKHHAVQVWRTPFLAADAATPTRTDAFLSRVGNAAVVQCMSECHEILNLLRQQDSYDNLYLDLKREAQAVADAYFWIADPGAFDLKAPLLEIVRAAEAAIAEYDRVVSLRRIAVETTAGLRKKLDAILREITAKAPTTIELFVGYLSSLRALRGEIISARELRYVATEALTAMETEAAAKIEALSGLCVTFLLTPEALAPYETRVTGLRAGVDRAAKTAEADAVEKEITAAAAELEMLIEIVGNLKIEDATETTRIIERISTVYAEVNQIRSLLKNRRREMMGVEMTAQFAAQMKLLEQGVANYLDLSDTAAKCDENLNRLMVQVEELEGRFADFDEYIEALATRREEIHGAFTAAKVRLTEERQRRAATLQTTAERILKGVAARAATMKSLDELNAYFASDLMIERVRETVKKLAAIDENLRADDLLGRLKAVEQEATRTLKDRLELFEGADVIRLGSHRFAVNTRPVEVTIIRHDDAMQYHLTGTHYFEPIPETDLAGSPAVWEQEICSETREVYRAEYLAFLLLESMTAPQAMADFIALDEAARLERIRAFMSTRYDEGYVRGVHDVDAEKIASILCRIHAGIGRLKHTPAARAAARLFWSEWRDQARKASIEARIRGLGAAQRVFASAGRDAAYGAELAGLIREFVGGKTDSSCQAETSNSEYEEMSFRAKRGILSSNDPDKIPRPCFAGPRNDNLHSRRWFDPALADEAARYLVEELRGTDDFVVSRQAAEFIRGFEAALQRRNAAKEFEAAREAAAGMAPIEVAVGAADRLARYEVIRDWLAAHQESASEHDAAYLDEAAAILHLGGLDPARIADAEVTATIAGMVGVHGAISNGAYDFHYHRFMDRLRAFNGITVPAFRAWTETKKRLIEKKRAVLRLETFRPSVLTTFVRNRLIDDFYLPMIGANMAKQIGAVGAEKRTDRMGLLLLISPPGYGKTTLMEYIAERLGLVFMKINGPALGERVTSLDPEDAPNAAARDEIRKLNMGLEMGDNIVLFIDDIQHTNPEFLQKFISLCDAQRRIEGVHHGQPRSYDLRGRKVLVVMAGNPYTESGEKFRIPDMLANRADTYNLGDVVAENAAAFEMSFIENAITSNRILARLAGRGQKDIQALIRLAASGGREAVTFDGQYAPEEVSEMVEVVKRLLTVRDLLLKVNQEYIRSAAQADAYRTEPPFRLQGSYRNMCRLAEKILPIMNEAEVDALLMDYYRNEAQTLTTGAETSLLKLKELHGSLTEEETTRWNEIRRTFQRNLLVGEADESDPVGRVVGQLVSFRDGLDRIRETIAGGMTAGAKARAEAEAAADAAASEAAARAGEPSAVETSFSEKTIALIKEMLAEWRASAPASPTATAGSAGPSGTGGARIVTPMLEAEPEAGGLTLTGAYQALIEIPPATRGALPPVEILVRGTNFHPHASLYIHDPNRPITVRNGQSIQHRLRPLTGSASPLKSGKEEISFEILSTSEARVTFAWSDLKGVTLEEPHVWIRHFTLVNPDGRYAPYTPITFTLRG